MIGLDFRYNPTRYLFSVAVAGLLSVCCACTALLDTESLSGSNLNDGSANDGDAAGPGLTITPTTGLTTSEGGKTATFTVVLNQEPSADVTIDLESSDTSEGTVAPTQLVFTQENWASAKTVTATGVDDAVSDNDQTYSIVFSPATSDDPKYSGLDADDISIVNSDDETPGITITPTAGLTTNEDGGTATFSIVLSALPTANVTVKLSSTMTNEGTVSPSEVVFTTSTWNTSQTVTITGVDDDRADGAQSYTIETAPAVSTDPNYSGIDAPDVALSNQDNDSAGINITPPSSLNTDEDGKSIVFSFVLSTEPTSDVVIDLSSSDPGEGRVSPAQLTFKPSNWKSAQNVTITGVDDDVQDSNIKYNLVVSDATSNDPAYQGSGGQIFELINTNRTAGVTVTASQNPTTTEVGGKATFTVVLASRPLSSVTIPLLSTMPDEGKLSSSALTFSPTSWNTSQTVTITGQDDDIDDGDISYSIRIGQTSSSDVSFNEITPSITTLNLKNTDNDSAGLRFTPLTGLTSAPGEVKSFSVVLTSEPLLPVSLQLSSSDTSKGNLNTGQSATLTFEPGLWDRAQTISVRTASGGSLSGTYTIQVNPAGDAKYGALATEFFPVTIAP